MVNKQSLRNVPNLLMKGDKCQKMQLTSTTNTILTKSCIFMSKLNLEQ